MTPRLFGQILGRVERLARRPTDTKSIRLLSGKLGGDNLEGNRGVPLTGSEDGKHLSAMLDAPVKKGAKAATVRGKLELVCP